LLFFLLVTVISSISGSPLERLYITSALYSQIWKTSQGGDTGTLEDVVLGFTTVKQIELSIAMMTI
jgi:hypothetical protein